MTKYKCVICGYTYDSEIGIPDKNIPEGTGFQDLADDFKCPSCGAGKTFFNKI